MIFFTIIMMMIMKTGSSSLIRSSRYSSTANYNHSICEYLDDHFSTKILSIDYYKRDQQLWIITNDSYIHRLLPLIPTDDRWDYQKIDSKKLNEKYPNLSLYDVKRILLMLIKEYEDYFLLFYQKYDGIGVYDIDGQENKLIDKIESSLRIEWNTFIDGEIKMIIDDYRLLIIKKQEKQIYQYYLFEIKIKTEILVEEQMGSILCTNDKNLNGSFCSMLSKHIVMNFFDGNQWNFIDRKGRIYQIDKYSFTNEFITKMNDIKLIENNIKTISNYFECYDENQIQTNNHTIDNIDIIDDPEKINKTILIVIISIAVLISFIVLVLLLMWYVLYQKQQKLKQIIQKKQQKGWDIDKSKKTKLSLEMSKKRRTVGCLPYESISTKTENTKDENSFQNLDDLISISSFTDTFDEMSEKSFRPKSIKKIIIPTLTSPKQSWKNKMMSILPSTAATTMTTGITLSDYFTANDKDKDKDKKKTKTKSSSPRTISPDISQRNGESTNESSFSESHRTNRKAQLKAKQKRREERLIKVMKILAKDSEEFRKQRRLLRIDDKNLPQNLITRSRELKTDPKLIRDLLENLDRHRERKRRRKEKREKRK